MYAFEPCALNFKLLQSNVSNHHLFRLAVSVQGGIDKLYTYGDSLGNNTQASFWDKPPGWGNDQGHEIITKIRLDDISLPHVSFIKIDVEGSELRVLRGAVETLRTHKPALCVEFGSDEGLSSAGIEYNSTDIRTFLSQQGYTGIGSISGNNYFIYAGDLVTTF